MCSRIFAQYTKFLPYFLDKKFLNQGKNKDFVVIDCGIPGTNMKNIAERINEQINYYQPDIIVTMMGINDATFNEKKIYKQLKVEMTGLHTKKHKQGYRLFKLIRCCM